MQLAREPQCSERNPADWHPLCLIGKADTVAAEQFLLEGKRLWLGAENTPSRTLVLLSIPPSLVGVPSGLSLYLEVEGEAKRPWCQ